MRDSMKKAMAKYSSLCGQIFFRAQRVEALLSSKAKVGTYGLLELEKAALDIRKICECFAFLGLVGNEAKFNHAYQQFERKWKISEVLKITEKLNGDQLPQPIEFTVFENERLGGQFTARAVDCAITPEILLEVHGRSSFFLHAINPYKVDLSVEKFEFLLDFPKHVAETLKKHELSNDLTAFFGYTPDGGEFNIYLGEITK